MKRILSVLLAALVLCLTACGSTDSAPQTAKTKFTATRLDLFDTVISLTGYAADKSEFDATAQKLFDEMARLHKYYDVYNEYDGIANICTINNCAGGGPVETDPCVIDLLCLARDISEKSGGRADITAGSVLRLWHDARTDSLNDPDHAYIPEAQAIENALEHRGFDRVEIDTEKNTVRLTDPDILLDVGAIAKGYAVQRVCEQLPEGYLLSAGGNVCAPGPKPDGTKWTVGVQDPDGDPSSLLLKLAIERGAVVTSGDYQRVYEVDGVRYHHIIDLETGRPADRWRAVTVICPDSGVADGLSTALFVMSKEEGQKLLDACGAEALWVDPDKNLSWSEGFEACIVK